MTEYQKAIQARTDRYWARMIATEQAKHLTFKPSDFHNLSCKPMMVKR